MTFVVDPSVATRSTSSKVKRCDQSFVVKCVATLLFYCLSLWNSKGKDMKAYGEGFCQRQYSSGKKAKKKTSPLSKRSFPKCSDSNKLHSDLRLSSNL